MGFKINDMAFSIKIMIVLSFIFFNSCNSINDKKDSSALVSDQKNNVKAIAVSNDTAQDVAKIKSINTANCLKFIKGLIAESSLKNDIPSDFVLSIDDSTKDSYLLKIANRNEETGDEIAIKWVTLDFTKHQLLDMTNDPDVPIQLKFNKDLFDKVVSCLGK